MWKNWALCLNKNPPKAIVVEGEGEDIIATVVVSKVNIDDRNKDQVIDSRAIKHIYSSFFDYTLVTKGEEVIYLGDSRSTSVQGKGKFLLKLTSRKTLLLTN